MANSVNGWPLDPRTQTISAGGKSTTVRAGDVATVLQYIAQQWHRRIEAIVTLHGYRSSKTNAAIGGDPGSNHISGTAIDVNGFRHPYEQGKGYKDQGFSAAQVSEMRQILSPVNDVVQWGYDYPKNWRDGMHMQIRKGVSTAAVAAAARRVATLTSNPGGGPGNPNVSIPGGTLPPSLEEQDMPLTNEDLVKILQASFDVVGADGKARNVSIKDALSAVYFYGDVLNAAVRETPDAVWAKQLTHPLSNKTTSAGDFLRYEPAEHENTRRVVTEAINKAVSEIPGVSPGAVEKAVDAALEDLAIVRTSV